jgi:hypothetical protein
MAGLRWDISGTRRSRVGLSGCGTVLLGACVGTGEMVCDHSFSFVTGFVFVGGTCASEGPSMANAVMSRSGQ